MRVCMYLDKWTARLRLFVCVYDRGEEQWDTGLGYILYKMEEDGKRLCRNGTKVTQYTLVGGKGRSTSSRGEWLSRQWARPRLFPQRRRPVLQRENSTLTHYSRYMSTATPDTYTHASTHMRAHTRLTTLNVSQRQQQQQHQQQQQKFLKRATKIMAISLSSFRRYGQHLSPYKCLQ